eukprot:TRINITY_DN3364_c0_g1_i3.p1 TRINITY_DN3364_c0_g1~~TRINITY_DN3364_c0_g1_i3.p1  ORF type:complete len:119 (-),score=8.23 TRINITY_DN3364_c0_g1_i3:96-452(-)
MWSRTIIGRVRCTHVQRRYQHVDTPTSQLLYRGIPKTSEAYEDALKGTVIPFVKGVGQNDFSDDHILAATEHNQGMDSGFTSWTKNKQTAEIFAGEEGCVLTARCGPDHGQVSNLLII